MTKTTSAFTFPRIRSALSERVTYIAGVGVVIVGFGVVLATLFQPYWFDEANTIAYIHQSFPRMLQLVANDFAPPLYHTFLFLWVRFFSDGEVVTAVPSLFFAAGSVWLTFRFGQQLFSRQVAWAASLLFATSFSLMYYAQETRMYTLLLALGVASTSVFHRLLMRGRRVDWWCYFFASLAGVYTHYPFWFLLAAHNVAVIIFYYRQWGNVKLKFWFLTQVGLIAAYLPWIFYLMDRVMHWYLGGPTFLSMVFPIQLPWMPLLRVLGLMVAPFAPEAVGAPSGGPAFVQALWLPAQLLFMILAGIVISLFLRVRLPRQRFALMFSFQRDAKTPAVVLLSILVAVPVLIMTLLDVSLFRYIIFITPFFCCLLVHGIFRIPHVVAARSLFFVLLTVIAALNSSFFLIFFFPRSPRAFLYEWPAAAQYISTREIPGREIIAFVYPDQEVMFRYYYHGQLPLVSFIPGALDSGDPEISRVRWIGRSGQIKPNDVPQFFRQYVDDYAVWVLSPEMAWLYDPKRLVWRWLERNCYRSERVTFRLGSELTLYRYDRCVPASMYW